MAAKSPNLLKMYNKKGEASKDDRYYERIQWKSRIEMYDSNKNYENQSELITSNDIRRKEENMSAQ